MADCAGAGGREIEQLNIQLVFIAFIYKLDFALRVSYNKDISSFPIKLCIEKVSSFSIILSGIAMSYPKTRWLYDKYQYSISLKAIFCYSN